MAKTFIIGALLPTGGAYMAYHVGRLLARYFGYELIDVQIVKPERMLFDYDMPLITISKKELEQKVTADDLLIITPAFSEHFYGLRLPCRKIMYVQGFPKPTNMDCHCDLYVSVSQKVCEYIKIMYGITSPVIPAFIELDKLPQTPDWNDRPAGSVLVYAKDSSPSHQNLYQYVYEALHHCAREINLGNVLDGFSLTHGEFLQKIGSARYLLNLSLAEGFGLIPLEAMAMGTCVIGLDGLSGRDYMRPGENCLTESMTNLRRWPDTIIRALQDETLAYKCAEEGKKTAANYGYEPFRQAWVTQLATFLERTSGHA